MPDCMRESVSLDSVHSHSTERMVILLIAGCFVWSLTVIHTRHTMLTV